LSSWSRLCAADIDGDGVEDLVVMLVLADPSNAASYETDLLLLRGKRAPSTGAFPYFMSTGTTPPYRATERATSVVAGDFAHTGSHPEPIEVAVAFPDQSNHVSFFRYAAGASPGEDRLIRSSTDPNFDALIAGDQPAQLVAADFDHNNTI